MILADSNIVIYAASGKYPQVTDWFTKEAPAVSAITMVEVLGYYKLTVDEKAVLEDLFGNLTVIYPTVEVFRIAIHLRQQRKVSLADALIAGTALHHQLPLATHNTTDYAWIDGVTLLDPLTAS